MNDIYQYNREFDNGCIIDKINQISDALQQKNISEDRRRELIYAQFIQGLKLSTRNNRF